MITIEVSIGDVLEHAPDNPPQKFFWDRVPWWLRSALRQVFGWPPPTFYEVWEATGEVARAFAKTLAESEEEPVPETTQILQEEQREWN